MFCVRPTRRQFSFKTDDHGLDLHIGDSDSNGFPPTWKIGLPLSKLATPPHLLIIQQGSSLGSILFALYILSLGNSISPINFIPMIPSSTYLRNLWKVTSRFPPQSKIVVGSQLPPAQRRLIGGHLFCYHTPETLVFPSKNHDNSVVMGCFFYLCNIV